MRLSDQVVTPIDSKILHCGGVANLYQHTGMAWTPDSRTVTVLAKHFQDLTCGVFLYETIVTSLSIGGSTSNSVPVTGLYLGAPSYTGDGALFSAYQWNATLGGCRLGWRPANSLATVAGTLDLTYGALTCFWWPDARSPSGLVSTPRGVPQPAPWPLAPRRVDCQPLAPRARP